MQNGKQPVVPRDEPLHLHKMSEEVVLLDDDAGEDEIVEEYNHNNYADLVGPPSKGAQQRT